MNCRGTVTLITQLFNSGRLREIDVIEVDGRGAFRDVAACFDPDSGGPRLVFQRVPRRRPQRTGCAWTAGQRAAAPTEVDRVVALGSTVAWITSDRVA